MKRAQFWPAWVAGSLALLGAVMLVGASPAHAVPGCGSYVYLTPIGQAVSVDYTACPDTGSGRLYDTRVLMSYGNGQGAASDNDGVGSIGGATDPILSVTVTDAGSVVNAWIEQGTVGAGNGAPLWGSDYEFDAFFMACGRSVSDWAAANIKNVVKVNNFLTFASIVDLCPAVIPTWHQSFGRASSEALCPAGWVPSWAAWAQGSTGGWVCNREVPSLG